MGRDWRDLLPTWRVPRYTKGDCNNILLFSFFNIDIIIPLVQRVSNFENSEKTLYQEAETRKIRAKEPEYNSVHKPGFREQ